MHRGGLVVLFGPGCAGLVVLLGLQVVDVVRDVLEVSSGVVQVVLLELLLVSFLLLRLGARMGLLRPWASAQGRVQGGAHARGCCAAVVQGLEGPQQDLHRASICTPILCPARGRGPRRSATPTALLQESLHGAARRGGEQGGRRQRPRGAPVALAGKEQGLRSGWR